MPADGTRVASTPPAAMVIATVPANRLTRTEGRTVPGLSGLLGVATELLAHRRQYPVGEVCLPPRAEPFEQGCRQDMGGDPFLHGGPHGPSSLAGVGDAPREAGHVGVLRPR